MDKDVDVQKNLLLKIHKLWFWMNTGVLWRILIIMKA
jgi:hypothetical protein